MAKKKKTNYTLPIIILIVAIILISVLIAFNLNSEKVVAKINHENIYESELDTEYQRLPLEYKELIAKEELLQQIIERKLLLQEAKKSNIGYTQEEIDNNLAELKSPFTEEEFQALLDEQGYSEQELITRISEQTLVNKLINITIISNIEITDQQIKSYYENNQELFVTEQGLVSLSEANDLIRDILIREAATVFFERYIQDLLKNSNIQIYDYQINEFLETANELCKLDGKPILRFYTTSTCENCKKIQLSLLNAIYDYNVELYTFTLDSDKLSKQELEILKEHNPEGAVPSFLFGCKYFRAGIAYSTFNPSTEEVAFREVLDKLE